MIRIVVPFYSEFDYLKPSLRALRATAIPHEVVPVHGSLPAMQRNFGVTGGISQKIFQKLDSDISHYLFIDSDIAFPSDVVRVMKDAGKDILGLPYRRHENPREFQAGWFGKTVGNLKQRAPDTETGLKKVDFVGTGMLLVSRRALEKMPYPWFRYGLLEEDGNADLVGEDMGFCLLAASHGLDVWCHFDFPVSHRLRVREDFDAAY